MPPSVHGSKDSCSNKDSGMTKECLCRGVLIVFLCVFLGTPAEAQTGKIGPDAGPIIAGVVAALAAVVVVTVVVIHESSKKRMLTGCVNSGENGMTVTDEKDKRTYIPSGNGTGLKPNDRFALHRKKVKPKRAHKLLFWEASNETKGFGACQA
jgi:hypothetical protein